MSKIEFINGKIHYNQFKDYEKKYAINNEDLSKSFFEKHKSMIEDIEERNFYLKIKAKEEELEKREKAVEKAEKELQSKLLPQKIDESVTKAVDKALNNIFKDLKN